MKKFLTPIRGALAGAFLFCTLKGAPLLAQTTTPAALPITPNPLTLDPTGLILQGGGFALAVYMVIWLTKSFTKAMENNTATLVRLETSITQALDRLKPGP